MVAFGSAMGYRALHPDFARSLACLQLGARPLRVAGPVAGAQIRVTRHFWCMWQAIRVVELHFALKVLRRKLNWAELRFTEIVEPDVATQLFVSASGALNELPEASYRP